MIRRVSGRAPSASGALWIPDDLDWGVELELCIGAWAQPSATDVPGLGTLLGNDDVRQVTLRAPRMRPTVDGPWRSIGEICVGRVSKPAPMTVTYLGVYLTGEYPNAWLTACASVACNCGAWHRREALELAAECSPWPPTGFDPVPPIRPFNDPGHDRLARTTVNGDATHRQTQRELHADRARASPARDRCSGAAFGARWRPLGGD